MANVAVSIFRTVQTGLYDKDIYGTQFYGIDTRCARSRKKEDIYSYSAVASTQGTDKT